jgi:single-strand DNA-binding protein
MGRLTADPELRTTTGGRSVVSFTLACDRSFARQGAERETDFIDIVVWGPTAEFVSKYFHKGQLVAVSGRIQTRRWKDRDDRNRVSVEVVADEVHFAEAKRPQSGNEFSRPEAAPRFNDAPESADDHDDDFNEFGGNEDDLPF